MRRQPPIQLVDRLGDPEGWALGSEEFRKELLEAMGKREGDYLSGEELHESDEQRAERIMRERLAKLGWTKRDLKAKRKGDLRNLKLAKQLREETTMTLKWISKRLHAGTWTHLNNRLYHVEV